MSSATASSSTAPVGLSAIAPFFVVHDVSPSIAFYRDALGFELTYVAPGNDPFFAILSRGGAQIRVKAILPDVPPLPTPKRHPWARWDAFVSAPDPDSLAAEFETRGVEMHVPLADTDDNLRGFELKDPDGSVLFFGRPIG